MSIIIIPDNPVYEDFQYLTTAELITLAKYKRSRQDPFKSCLLDYMCKIYKLTKPTAKPVVNTPSPSQQTLPGI